MNALEKAKKLKQLTQLLEEKNQSKGLALAKVIKSILALRDELGMATSVGAPLSNQDHLELSAIPLVDTLTGNEVIDLIKDTDDDGEKIDYAKGLLNASKSFFQANLQGRSYTNAKLGEVSINRKVSWTKMAKAMTYNELRAKLLPSIPKLIQKGVYSGSQQPREGRKDNALMFHFIVGMVQVGDELVEAGLSIVEYERGKFSYNLSDSPSELLAKKEASRLSEGLQSSPTSFDSIGTQIDQQINLVILSVRKKDDNDAQVSNPLYQSIIDGTKSLSLDVVDEVIAEGEKEPEHWQLAQAVNILAKQAIEQSIVSKDELQSIAGQSMMFDDTGFDSWLLDGHYEQLPVSKLAVSTLADKIHCKPTKDNDPLLVFEPKQGKYLILIGSDIFEQAEIDDVDYLPCVILSEDEGYDLELIKKFISKNTHRKFDAKDFAFELEEFVADTAELSV